MTLKLTQGCGVVLTTTSGKTKRILLLVKGYEGKFGVCKCFLHFQYDKVFYNEGIYDNPKTAEHAFRCFLEVCKEFE